MSIVEKGDMTTLRPASQSAETAASALDDIQLMAVAYAINNAANTGEYRAIFQDKLRPFVIDQLKANGYTIKYIHNNAYDMEHHALIIWGQSNPADKFTEPSNSGPKYNTQEQE